MGVVQLLHNVKQVDGAFAHWLCKQTAWGRKGGHLWILEALGQVSQSSS